MASLLRAHGHPEADTYPLPKLATECAFVQAHLKRQVAQQAQAQSLAYAATQSRKGSSAFTRLLKQLTGG